MSLRDTMNENPKVAMGVAVGIVVIALAFMVNFLRPSSIDPRSGGPVKCFYTDDEGKTQFADEVNKPTPIKSPNGKDAYIVRIYEDSGGNKVPLYIEKYTDAGNRSLKSGNITRQIESEKMIRKPNAKNWVAIDSEEGQKIKRSVGNMAEVRPK